MSLLPEKPAVVTWSTASVLGHEALLRLDREVVERLGMQLHRRRMEEDCAERGFEIVAEPLFRTFTQGRYLWLETMWPVRRREAP